jgi:hypothetical protein
MQFAQAKRQLIEALRNQHFQHEIRKGESKNYLADERITIAEAITIIEKTKGHQASTSWHHFDPQLPIWIFRPDDWYIKFYFKNGLLFISFHPSEERP